jgi:hypothetical protein
MSKEPGEMFFEAIDWPNIEPVVRAQWARAEIAVRAHERAAVLEEAAKVALEQRWELGTPWDLACTTIADAIRALKGGDNGQDDAR